MARKTNRGARRTQILSAALRLLRHGGLQGFSTAALAAEANCSKETLYNWFGDKQGILNALAEAQSAALAQTLEAALADGQTPAITRLEAATAALIDLYTGDASLAVNRAAISDASGALGATLLQGGRARSGYLFVTLIEKAQAEGALGAGDPASIFDRLLALAVGERQIRALLGDGSARPRGEEFDVLAALAVADLQRLFPS